MTINEVEARTGLERATVRYYEKEKLISPAREGNGYRNYSEEDIEKLEKIKLLRALDFSLEDIRSMDEDGADFSERLRARARSLEARAEDIEDARRVIENMLADNAAYETLQSGVYLEQMKSPAPALPDSAPEEPEESAEPEGVWVSPWRRFFARWLDNVFCSVLLNWLWVDVAGIPMNGGLWISIVKGILLLLAILLTESLFLCTLGTTPGKLLLGLRVRDEDGRRLGWSAALERTSTVLFTGEGLHIPVISFWRNWVSYRDANEGMTLLWEYQGRVEAKRETDWRHYVCFFAGVAVSVFLTVLIVSAPYMPENRGALTPREFAENVNSDTGIYERFLLEDGAWRKVDQPNVIHVDDPGWDWEPEPVELLVEGNTVTGFRFHASGEGARLFYFSGELSVSQTVAERLVTALVGADRGEFLTYFPLSSFQTEFSSKLALMTDFTMIRGDWTITVAASWEGNDDTPMEPAPFDLTVSVERAG